MKKFFKKIKKNWKVILVTVLSVTVVFGAIGGLATMFGGESEKISASEFSRGGLDENGDYVSTKQSIYTKDMFNCIGLRVVPDFECNSTYDVYYYDYNGNYIDSRLGLEGIYDEDFPLAQAARIVIHPEIPEDTDSEEFEIGYFEVYDIAKDFKITVDKDQENKYSASLNYYSEDQVTKNKTFFNGTDFDVSKFDSTNLVELTGTGSPMKVTNKIAVDGSYAYYDVFVQIDGENVRRPIAAMFGADGKCITDDGEYVYDTKDVSNIDDPTWIKLTIEVPELESYDGVHLMVTLPEESNCYIYAYNAK